MKRKSFKKALAGISAAAMLVSAMPMTLIADAYSSTSMVDIDDVLGTWASMADRANDQDSRYMYADTLTSAPDDYDQVQFSDYRVVIDGNYDKLGTFDVKRIAKYQYEEVYATQSPTGPEDKTTVLSAKFDFAQAEADLIEALREQGNDRVTAIEFYENEQTDGAKFGLIKTITLNMPVNNAGVNAGVETTEYEDIEFTVVRNQDDIIASFSDNALNEARHIILADDIDLTSATYYGGEGKIPASLKKQLSYTGDIDINLNGCTLTTKAGIQVSGKKMRIWGNGEISSADGLNTAGTPASTLAAYGSAAVIELYDNVKILNQDTGNNTKAAISGEGALIMCGDNVVVQHDGGKAIGTASTGGITTFVAGDYLYNNAGTRFDGTDAVKNAFKPNGTTANDVNVTTATIFSTMKIHNYNKYGFEVTDRTGDYSNSQNYLDVDPSTPNVMDYGYEPIRNYDSGNQKAGDTIEFDVTASDISTPNVYAENIGQLYFLAQQINDGKGLYKKVSAKLANTEFDFSKAPTPWTPIDASAIDLVIDGQFTDNSITKYSVIKNLNVEVASGDAGFVAKTSTNGASSIKNLGFENATVTGASVTGKESTGVVVGYGDSVAIQNVYVNNSAVKGTIKGGNYTGAIAGTLYNSTIDHTYSAAYVQPVAIISGSTVTYLAKNGVKTNEGLTNFYDKGLVTPAAGSSSATYLVGETSANFKKGTVAFKLNGHNPAQEVASATLKGWSNGDNSGTGSTSCSVNTYNTAPYNGTYEADVFGQTLDGTKYPTFIDVTNAGTKVASNRVFREIITTCTGVKTAWTATNANFLNTEVDKTKGGHTDAKNDGICDVCNAYEISEKNFDKSLIPFLSQEKNTKYGIAPDSDPTPFAGDGWLNPTEIAAIKSVVIDLTTEDTSSLKVSDIVNAINAEDAKGNAAPTLKGISVLNQKFDNGKLVAASYDDVEYVKNYEFRVNDAVLCRYVEDAKKTDAPKKEGFLVATNAAGSNTYAAVASSWSAFEGKTATSSSMQSVANATVADKNDFYVFADKDASGSIPTAQFTYDTAHNAGSPKPVTFQIAFRGGVKHNDVQDYKDGSLDASLSPVGDHKVEIVPATAGESKHTYEGVDCGCVIKTEECRAVASEITPSTHTMECQICHFKNATGGDAKAQDHAYEIMFTIGNVTVKRCIGCGYVTAVKDTNITTGTPVLSLRKATDGATGAETTYWRQTYDFNIAVGDGELVSYGVLYKKNPTASIGVDGTKTNFVPAATGSYFNLDGSLNTEKLAADGANYTSKKGITTSGTYRVNVDMANSDEAVQIVGYVVYKAAVGGTVTVKTTDLTNYTFEDLAKAEMEACNFVTEAGMTTTTDLKPQFIFDYDLGENYTFKQYGLLVTRNADKPVTEKTVLADAVAYDKTLITSKICYTNRTVAASVKSVKYGANVSMAAGETATVRGYAVITDQYGLTWEIYSEVQNHRSSAS